MTIDLMSVEEVSQRLGMGINQTYRACQEHLFPCTRFGRRWIISRRAFELWLEEVGFGELKSNHYLKEEHVPLNQINIDFPDAD